MRANFDSTCPACESPIVEGAEIACGLDGWQHAACPAEKPKTPVCGTCFQHTSMTGTCGCEADQ